MGEGVFETGGGEHWVGRGKDLNNKGYLVGTKGAGDAR